VTRWTNSCGIYDAGRQRFAVRCPANLGAWVLTMAPATTGMMAEANPATATVQRRSAAAGVEVGVAAAAEG
jgi:hypothetical protein